ncbi:probable serine/threonine-protein kinase At1g01540 [Coffea arabica]|uniref:Probable serine/threonine-protein kinase At1g01540 n=1 Tax=Coffea arabica TaxID=13443 RepID=A0ABM4VCI3_COFAR
MIDVASALQYLHQEYLTPAVHCDLKPSNVLLDEDMVACVSDFGIAKLLGKEESFALTKTFATIGYIAPGQLNLKSRVNDSMPDAILEVIDPNLLNTKDEHLEQKLECIGSLMKLASNCALDSPNERLKYGRGS